MLEFDGDKLVEHRVGILYLLGQLQVVHTHEKFMRIEDGLMDYKGKIWTKNNMAVFALYYMGTAAGCIPGFAREDGVSYTIIDQEHPWYNTMIMGTGRLKPTFWPPK